MFTVLEIAAFPDFIPVTSSDRRRKIPVSDRSPWAAKVRATIPAAVPENEVQASGLDDVVVPSIGDGKAVVVQVDEIRASVDHYDRASSKVDIEIDFRVGIGLRTAEQHPCKTGCQNEGFFHR